MRHILLTLIALVGIMFMVLLYVMWCIFVPVRTLVINNFSYTAPIFVDTPVVHPGDLLKYKLDYCKYTDVPATAHRLLVDGQQIPLTNSTKTPATLLKGCHVVDREVPVPDTVNPGRYYMDVEIDYQVNIFHTERVYYYTQYFQVVSRSVPSTSEPAPQLFTPAIPSPQEAKSAIMGQ